MNECESPSEDRFSGSVEGRKTRIFELAAEVARLVCVRDVAHVDDPEGRRALDVAANEIGFLLRLPEPEFENIWREDDTLGHREKAEAE